jgi:photosystem II stability/assembly factor-like uncharacterized protein
MIRSSNKLRLGLAAIALALAMGCAASDLSSGSLESAGEPGGSAGAGASDGGSATGGSKSTGGSTSTGGSKSTGGSTGAGGASATGGGPTDGASEAPPHVVGKCDNLGPAGTLENITPAALDIAKWCWPGSKDCTADQFGTYGAHGLAIDPTDSGTLYLGTDRLGMWKTTDCGANWVKIDTGTHQAELDSGRNWTIVVDPVDSQVVYTTPGYGAEGFYKSTDGGVNWDSMFPKDIQTSLPYGGFIETISLDPSDHQHLLATFHGSCSHSQADGGDWQCMAESMDAAATWRLIPSPIGWSEGFGQTMIDSKIWFLSDGGGIYRTADGGATWTKVYDKGASGHIFLAPDGTFFTGGYYMRKSTDGITWTEIPGSPTVYSVNGSNAIVSDGTRLFTSTGQYGGGEPKDGYYRSALLSDPSKWTPIFGANHPLMQAGGSTIIYDPDHHLFYSTNLTAGIWRGVVPP